MKAVGEVLGQFNTAVKVSRFCAHAGVRAARLSVKAPASSLIVSARLVRSAPDLFRDVGELAGPSELARAVETGAVLTHHAARMAWRGVTDRDDLSAGAARELRQTFEDLGPTYVKLGQVIASSPIFPATLSEEFRACLDSVAPIPYTEIQQVIFEELGTMPELAFGQFDPEPLAAASIAQVHAARLHDGRQVVVKVQRPGIGGRLHSDLAILKLLARFAERTSDTAWMVNPVAVLEDFAATVAAELDFLAEAHSMERFEENLRAFGRNDGVRVPKVHWDLTTRRMLTMEHIQGCRIDDLSGLAELGVDPGEALVSICRAWVEGAFHHGFVHGDLHAGNLMVDRDGRVVFLDFGIVGQLDESTRRLVGNAMVPLIVNSDFTEMAKVIFRLGGKGEIAEAEGLEHAARDIASVIEPVLAAPLSELSLGQLLVDVLRVGSRHQLRFPQEVILLAKAALYMDRFSRLMAPEWSMLADPELVWFLMGGSPAPDVTLAPLSIPIVSDLLKVDAAQSLRLVESA